MFNYFIFRIIIYTTQIDQFKDVAQSDNFTTVGVMFAVIIALAIAVVYLYKRVERMQKSFVDELKAMNEATIKMMNGYNEFVEGFRKLVNRD